MLNLVQQEDLAALEDKIQKLTSLCLGLQSQIDKLQTRVYRNDTITIAPTNWPYTFKDVAHAQKTGL